MNKVNVKEFVKMFNEYYYGVEEGNNVLKVEEFNKGSGVYGIFLGSRGWRENSFKVEGDFNLKSKEELIDEFINVVGEDEDYKDCCDEVINVIDWNNIGGVYLGLGLEGVIEYYDVVVE
jgi:hypothetical protein